MAECLLSIELHSFSLFGGSLLIYRIVSLSNMQPQDAQMMGQVAPAGAMGQQVIIVQNKSGGPKVFGILAIICGLLGAFGNLQLILAVEGEMIAVLIFGLGLVSWLVFCWAGVLLFQYQRKGVWVGFISVAIGALSTALPFIILEAALGGDGGGFFAAFGAALGGIQAVCCSAVVALPLLMNGADLE